MRKSRVFSIAAFLFLLIASVLFLYLAYRSQWIPIRLFVIAAVLICIVILLMAILVFKSKSGFLILLGGILSLVLSVVLLAAGLYFNRAVITAQKITTTKVEVSSVSVYMIADETNSSTALTSDMRYGILEKKDRENTDEIIKLLQGELESELTVQSYEDVTKALDALFNHEVDAVILNSALLNLLNETEGYEDITDRVREVKQTSIKREVPVPVVEETPRKSNPVRKNESAAGADGTPENRSFAVYISGIDNRGDLIEKSRSDVNIIAVINPDSHQVLLVTTPRDAYVPLKFPDYVSAKDKLTHAGIYGVQVSMDTLSMLYDIDIDYYFRVNFTGFIDIVEALGGVTVEVEEAFSTTEYAYEKGPNELNGYKALSFVRNRFGIGDQWRGRNQMAFIKGVINKVLSPEILLRFNDVLSSVEGCFETSMPYDLLSSLLREQIETGADWNIVSYAVSGSGNSAIPYSMDIEVYVLDLDYSMVDTAKALMQQVYDGKVITEP